MTNDNTEKKNISTQPLGVNEANALLQKFLNDSDNKLRYLISLDDIVENLSVGDIWYELDVFDKERNDYSHTQSEGIYNGTLNRNTIPLLSKNIEIGVNDSLIHFSKVEFLEGTKDKYIKANTILFGGRRTTFNDYEGVGFDEYEISEMLEIPIEQSYELWDLLYKDFGMFETLFKGIDNYVHSLYVKK